MNVNEELSGIDRLLSKLREGAAQMAVFEAIEQGLADVIELMRKQSEGGEDSDSDEIGEKLREALSALTINVQPTPVQITMPSMEGMPKMAFVYRVTRRDELGRIVEAQLTEQ